MKTSYYLHEYDKAKQFLADAVIVDRVECDTHVWTTWRKPDGSTWRESMSKLEYPYDGYNLDLEVQS